MKLAVSQDLFTKYPHLRIGVITGQGINNMHSQPEIAQLTQSAAESLRQCLTPETLPKHPYIAAWRNIYKSFGSKPSDYRPTAEALLRRILRGDSIAPISAVVDIYLAIEMEYYLPIGGYDLDHVNGDITLRFSPGNEPFFAIGSTTEEKTYAGEVIYADSEKILTRRWNYRDCDAAKITQDSQSIALFCEAPSLDIPTDHLMKLTNELADRLGRFCGGTISAQLLSGKDLMQ